MTSAENQHESTPQEQAAGTGGSQQDATPQGSAGAGAGVHGDPTPPDVRADDAWLEDPGAGAGEQPEGGDVADDSSTEITDDLAKAQNDVATLTADLQRLQAEYVNYKRRVDRDRELVKQNATFTVLSAMLPVLDDIDRAREHGELEGGFKAVADSLEGVVAGLGLDKFGEPGDEFDPNLHEALMHGHSPDVSTTTCQNIVQAGYRIGDRVVRPARVTVVDPEPAGDQGEPSGEER